MLDRGKNLQEHLLGLEVVSNIVAFLGDLGEQIAFRAVLNHDICALGRVENLDQGDHIGVLTSGVVQLDFTVLKFLLPWIQPNLVQRLDSVLHISLDVMGLVYGSVGTDSKDSCQLDGSGQEVSDAVFRMTD